MKKISITAFLFLFSLTIQATADPSVEQVVDAVLRRISALPEDSGAEMGDLCNILAKIGGAYIKQQVQIYALRHEDKEPFLKLFVLNGLDDKKEPSLAVLSDPEYKEKLTALLESKTSADNVESVVIPEKREVIFQVEFSYQVVSEDVEEYKKAVKEGKFPGRRSMNPFADSYEQVFNNFYKQLEKDFIKEPRIVGEKLPVITKSLLHLVTDDAKPYSSKFPHIKHEKNTQKISVVVTIKFLKLSPHRVVLSEVINMITRIGKDFEEQNDVNTWIKITIHSEPGISEKKVISDNKLSESEEPVSFSHILGHIPAGPLSRQSISDLLLVINKDTDHRNQCMALERLASDDSALSKFDLSLLKPLLQQLSGADMTHLYEVAQCKKPDLVKLFLTTTKNTEARLTFVKNYLSQQEAITAEVSDFLILTAEDASDDIRIWILGVLEKKIDEKNYRWVLKLIKSSKWDVRRFVAYTFEKWGKKTDAETLKPLLKDQDSDVQKAAQEAIEKLKTR